MWHACWQQDAIWIPGSDPAMLSWAAYPAEVIMSRAPAVTRLLWEWCMQMRYYRDPATGEPHIYNHGVTEEEVEEVIRRPDEDRRGREGSRVAIGQTRVGWEILAGHLCARPQARKSLCHHPVRVAGQAADRISTAAASER